MLTSNSDFPTCSIKPINAEIETLPHCMRENLTLTKILGRGAFGEVFEGRIETKVAVKVGRDVTMPGYGYIDIFVIS